MKIIGKTANGYLVETSEDEMANAFGFGWSGTKEWKEASAEARDRDGRIMIGGTLQIGASFSYLRALRERELSVKTAAKTLHELADMMLAGVPSVIVPPPQQGGSGEG